MYYSAFKVVLKLFILFFQTVKLYGGKTPQHDFVLESPIRQDSYVTLAETLTHPLVV